MSWTFEDNPYPGEPFYDGKSRIPVGNPCPKPSITTIKTMPMDIADVLIAKPVVSLLLTLSVHLPKRLMELWQKQLHRVVL